MKKMTICQSNCDREKSRRHVHRAFLRKYLEGVRQGLPILKIIKFANIIERLAFGQ